MPKSLTAISRLILLILILSACTKEEQLCTPEKVEVRVLFTPEGFCNIGYNDITLKAIEATAQKYGFEYSICVPEQIEIGMQDYRDWCNDELDEGVGRALYIFASGVYEEFLAKETHPDPQSGKEILIFEVNKELPYAYTFAMSYYGAAYMISHFYLLGQCCDFKIIAANPYLNGLDYLCDGINDAIEDNGFGSLEIQYLTNDPAGGLQDQLLAYLYCKALVEDDNLHTYVYVPYAGASNLGVYRCTQINHRICIGIDSLSPDFFSYIYMCMNKRIDLALDDFLQLWINKEDVPRHRFYTMESGRVGVDVSIHLAPWLTDVDDMIEEAAKKEREYFNK